MLGKVETIVFLSLVLDLFAFTIPLPLFPRIVDWYRTREASDPNGFLSRTLWSVQALRSFLYTAPEGRENARWDVVLLGGLMGSLFSTLQFLVSPRIGALSDKYGRKNILLLTMVGNLLSAIVWIQSTTFASFLLARAIGGLSEGNVQLAIAILSDVTTPEARSKALSLVGIAFSICFCIGPPIGAWFALQPASNLSFAKGFELNIYAWPAILTLILLSAETVFLAVALPETRGKSAAAFKQAEKTNGHASGNGHANGNGHTNGHANGKAVATKRPAAERLATLKSLKIIHFFFLALFSGVEFTITFLTYDLFDWSNVQNGRLIGFMGIISALLQGGYVRRAIPKVGEGVMARRGVQACTMALLLLAALPRLLQTSFATKFLYAAAASLAFTSATVVNSLNAYASVQCDEGVDTETGKPIAEDPRLAKGRAMGEYRSWGQLGRAIGPILACASYWTFGPSFTYATTACATTLLVMHMKSIAGKAQKS
ncbi:MFS general substrate transporter [Exidia glandulosa HHB12029]|uniref:MFS general substrate transporter n=1 Tax=Exidia glandulosa HHB12029 TaxID=1314781 RepID=A0A165QU85_EXIGL|nr:MFS general substrate transporter [Exidia glandulosa HHB12029]